MLQAIISDYVRTAEPVGSELFQETWAWLQPGDHSRNGYGSLEEMGYLTSACFGSEVRFPIKRTELYVEML